MIATIIVITKQSNKSHTHGQKCNFQNASIKECTYYLRFLVYKACTIYISFAKSTGETFWFTASNLIFKIVKWF